MYLDAAVENMYADHHLLHACSDSEERVDQYRYPVDDDASFNHDQSNSILVKASGSLHRRPPSILVVCRQVFQETHSLMYAPSTKLELQTKKDSPIPAFRVLAMLIRNGIVVNGSLIRVKLEPGEIVHTAVKRLIIWQICPLSARISLMPQRGNAGPVHHRSIPMVFGCGHASRAECPSECASTCDSQTCDCRQTNTSNNLPRFAQL
ncbi:uncharacterized protein M421DRAFT_158855 [Didymella exigua CBS 183.55]|uniref:Uncharacterized protein n=1 Tax=Didymella exigua CBS 183.55 TaxID=1150837 RepID=A0A6A5RIX9_9PLEO|nr:uncharacterized protein M421DRAFT_158855 [Didymella exigua CBS 183.55]KAF1928331.1 hypothetical protein M421DRAFT_158855 [Didymella exigua CBS 183.55]